MATVSKFKPGDKVACVRESDLGFPGVLGREYEVESVTCLGNLILKGEGGRACTQDRFELVKRSPCAEYGSLRPGARVYTADGARCAACGRLVSSVTATTGLPTNAKERKALPLYSGVVRYFPDALIAVAELSRIGNDQHNPGKPLHWDRSKSGDEHDALLRHLWEAGMVDTDGVRHSTKVAWRALAALQKEIEAAR